MAIITRLVKKTDTTTGEKVGLIIIIKATTAATVTPAKEVREGSLVSFATASYKWKCEHCREIISFEQCGFHLLIEDT